MEKVAISVYDVRLTEFILNECHDVRQVGFTYVWPVRYGGHRGWWWLWYKIRELGHESGGIQVRRRRQLHAQSSIRRISWLHDPALTAS
jgi:hypothetical protein